MAAFSNETIAEIEQVAREYGIEPATLLAIAEVESGGRAFAYVGGRKEPLIRFEGHYFDRLLADAPKKREQARRAGLAAPKWGVVKNPRGQADRWKLLERASRIDRSAAAQSVSWGLGQVMGSHWKSLGYSSVDALVREARSGVAGQVRLMLRFIRTNRLMGLLHARDWAGFARRYNGPAYKKNRYDTRMAAAYARHRQSGGAPTGPAIAPKADQETLSRGSRGERVAELQRMLTSAGHPVRVDGAFGPRTEAALRAFQGLNGLAVDGLYGPQSARALRLAARQSSDRVSGLPARLWRFLRRLFGFRR